MNKLLIQVLSFLACFGLSFIFEAEVYSQEYNKLLEQGKSWNIAHWVCGYGPCSYQTHTYSVENDSTINNLAYFEIEGNLLREDTIARKVFLWNNFYQEDQIIYDFNISEGDSIELFGTSDFLMIVDSTYTTLVKGKPRKSIAFKEWQGFNEVWIEGIGSNFGLVYPGFYFSLIDAGYELLCVYEGKSLIFQNAESCYISNVSVETIDQQGLDIYFIGNPNRLVFSNFPLQKTTVQLFDLTGTLVKQVVVEGTPQGFVGLTGLAPGLYLYRILEDISKTGKFIIPL